MFNRHLFSPAELFTPVSVGALPSMPIFTDHRFTPAPTQNRDFSYGAGLYFIGRKAGDRGLRVIYIGMFLGSLRDVFGGDVIQARWLRHISTIGLRGQRISISSNLQSTFTAAAPQHAIAEEIAAANGPLLAQDRGYCVSANRLMYAAQNWTHLFAMAPAQWIDEFVFGYVQLSGDFWRACPPRLLRGAIQMAEREAIHVWSPALNGLVVHPNGNTQRPTFIFDDIEYRLAKNLAATGCNPTFKETMRPTQEISQAMLQASESSDQAPEPAMAETVGALDIRRADEDAIDAFNERLPDGCPRDTVDSLLDFLLDIQDAKVHYTGTNGGDFRVIALPLLGGRPRNIFTMYWQVKKERFFCRTLVDHKDVVGAGIADAKPCTAGEPLWSEFTVSCVAGSEASVIAILDRAIQKFRLGAARP